ncbi:uncharacterized protein BXIN_2153 [Babesia sp. Xinjiang]|uniref:uncharacterized protein n=1 Tax=Babesia sp. Xinjiang TaxID=462227 RepID=UPI000A25F06D|nr:uncharacterized protein BXIN_2153 [Babesia sp. Xinjiang]ORM40480.1 hypothetical protein BXIN_2153 [Babesia sp. Xinjiang]
MTFVILEYLLAAVKLLLAISPLLLIVAIFVLNKNWNQRSADSSSTGVRNAYIDSDYDDETKEDW